MSWPESLDPMPAAVREYRENRIGFPSIERAIADAAIETLVERLVENEAEFAVHVEAFHSACAWADEADDRAEQAEAEVAELNRVLAAGREEYELAVAELNRRGEEVKRLTGLLCECCPHDSVNGDVCAACGLQLSWVDDGDHMGHFDLTARYEAEHDA